MTFIIQGVYITRHGKINFVDLAGSEMTKKTKSEGKTLEEANNINKMKENIVEMVLLELKPQQPFHHQYTFSFISIYFPSI